MPRRRPLVYTVEGSEGGPTVLHRLALAAAEEQAGRRSFLRPTTLVLAGAAAAAAVAASIAGPPGSQSAVAAAAAVFVLVLLVQRFLRSRRVVAESVLVVAGVGLQLQTHFADGRETVQFIDLQRVRAAVINEGIAMHRVIYYLALLVEGQEKLVVAFPCLQPRLEELLPVYESLKRVIDAAKAEREACEAFQRREGVIE